MDSILDKFFPNDVKRLILEYNLPRKEVQQKKMCYVLKNLRESDKTCPFCFGKIIKNSPLECCGKWW